MGRPAHHAVLKEPPTMRLPDSRPGGDARALSTALKRNIYEPEPKVRPLSPGQLAREQAGRERRERDALAATAHAAAASIRRARGVGDVDMATLHDKRPYYKSREAMW